MPATSHRAGLALAILLLLASAAEAAPDLLMGSGLGTPGSEVLLPLGHVADSEIVALQVDVVHDAAVLGVNGVSAGVALAGSDHELAWNLVSPGRLRIILLSRTNAPLPGGVLATLSLQVDAGAPLGMHALEVEGVELVSSLAAVVAPDVLTNGSVEVVACLTGDLHPAGVGDAALSLADFLQALRDLEAGTASGGRYAACADLSGGNVSCSAAPEAWCPSADGGSFTLADALVLRRLVTQVARLSCATCDSLPEAEAAPVPGDLAFPLGVVDVSDVLRILRAAVGLDALTPAEVLASDVAPADPAVGGVRTVRGDGIIDVQDVLIVLRAAVGLDLLDWALRNLILSLPDPASFVAFSATLTGLPPAAGTPALADANCANAEASGVDAAAGTWSLTCVSDPTLRDGVSGAIASFSYRAPEAVDVSSLSLSSELVDAALVSTAGALTLSAGPP